MKKIFIAAMLLGSALYLNAQTLYTSNGTLSGNRIVTMHDAGIARYLRFQPINSGSMIHINGTTGFTGFGTTSPDERVEINGNLLAKIGHFANAQPTNSTFDDGTDRNTKCLVLAGGATTNTTVKSKTFSYFDFPESSIDDYATIHLTLSNRDDMTRLRFWASEDYQSAFTLYDKVQSKTFEVYDLGSSTILTMPKAASYVLVGTSTIPSTAGGVGVTNYRMFVKGGILTEEVRVSVATGWADYVFADDYKLPTIPELEKYIKENGHLPNVPSAEQVKEQGIELGQMANIQQEKIEELTLYIIQQNKQLETQKDQLDQQQKEIDELKAAVKAFVTVKQ